jgi:predicted DNA-binding transcriptional regulator AlpA
LLDNSESIVRICKRMITYSTRQAAKKLGITDVALGKYIKAGKISAPQTVMGGARNAYVWTEAEIEHVRQLLPKIANGRKTRYQKLREKEKTQPRAALPQHAKTARAGGPGAVPHKSRKTKKK